MTITDGVAPSPARDPHALVVVEGNQGTGKTTISKSLAARLGAAYLHFPPGFSRLREELGLDTHVGPVPRLTYYLAATLHLAELVQRELRDRPVVCDRYAASPVSLVLADSSPPHGRLSHLWRQLAWDVPRPVVTLLLVADHGVARRRVLERTATRSLTPVEERTVSSRGFYERRAALLHEWSDELGPLREVDTTMLSPASAVERCWRIVESMLAEPLVRTPS